MIANLPDWAKFIFTGLCVLGMWLYIQSLEWFVIWYNNYIVANYDKLIAKRKADLEEKKALRRKRKADLAARRK